MPQALGKDCHPRHTSLGLDLDSKQLFVGHSAKTLSSVESTLGKKKKKIQRRHRNDCLQSPMYPPLGKFDIMPSAFSVFLHSAKVGFPEIESAKGVLQLICFIFT